jgi:DnaJ-class molecular chaperone
VAAAPSPTSSGPSSAAAAARARRPSIDELFAGDTTRTRGGSRRGTDVEQPVDVSLEEAFNGTSRVVQLTDERSGRTRRLEVKIPPGVADGSRVRVAAQGGPGVFGGPAGDLYLVVRVTPSPSFAREGDDLRVKVPARLTVAVLGGEIEVPTPRGGKLALTLPPETQNGRVFRLRGQGMPRLERPTERGDLYAEVQVELPQSLSERQRKLFEELAAAEA